MEQLMELYRIEVKLAFIASYIERTTKGNNLITLLIIKVFY